MGDWCGSVPTDQNQKDRDNGRETAKNTGREVKTKKEENFLTGEVFFLLTNPLMGDPICKKRLDPICYFFRKISMIEGRRPLLSRLLSPPVSSASFVSSADFWS